MAIQFKNGGVLVQDRSELPDVAFENLYLDFETSSGDPHKDSLNPWGKHCQIVGAALTGDDYPGALFIPLKVLLSAREWWQKILRTAKRWINANVKYDCHVLQNAEREIAHVWDKEVIDVTMVAKILDSDRTYKGGYGLDALSLVFLDNDISSWYNRLRPYLYRNDKVFNRDYGRIPLDILADYACQDAITTRDVYHYEMTTMPAACKNLLQMEIGVTKMLLDIERRGLQVDMHQVKLEELKSKHLMVILSERLRQILGHDVNPRSPNDMYDTLINFLGLPVVLWTNEEDDDPDTPHNPSFSKDAMTIYKTLPEVRNNPKAKEVVTILSRYREEATMNSLFWEPWPSLEVNGVLHSDYNQTVRSGRMSCKEPNAQQLNNAAKKCIHPREGMCFLSMDESQIEYRLIVHYTNNPTAVKAYNENPKTDFHKWVGDSCGVTRRTGKTINLALGFGMGRKKTVANLMTCEDLLDDNPSEFEIKRRATNIYETFHRNMPELKRTSAEAAATARRRGFVFNNHGRRLNLPIDRAHIGFNRVVQSEAADLFKEVTLRIYEETAGHGAYINALVHDECLVEIPAGGENEWVPKLTKIMTEPNKPYRVPLMTSHDVSYKSWGDCKS